MGFNNTPSKYNNKSAEENAKSDGDVMARQAELDASIYNYKRNPEKQRQRLANLYLGIFDGNIDTMSEYNITKAKHCNKQGNSICYNILATLYKAKNEDENIYKKIIETHRNDFFNLYKNYTNEQLEDEFTHYSATEINEEYKDQIKKIRTDIIKNPDPKQKEWWERTGGKRRKSRRNRKSKKSKKSRKNRRKSKRTSRR